MLSRDKGLTILEGCLDSGYQFLEGRVCIQAIERKLLLKGELFSSCNFARQVLIPFSKFSKYSHFDQPYRMTFSSQVHAFTM